MKTRLFLNWLALCVTWGVLDYIAHTPAREAVMSYIDVGIGMAFCYWVLNQTHEPSEREKR